MEPAVYGLIGAVIGAAFGAMGSYLAARRSATAVRHAAELQSMTAVRVAEIQAATALRTAYIAANAAYQSALVAHKATEALDPSANLPEPPPPPPPRRHHLDRGAWREDLDSRRADDYRQWLGEESLNETYDLLDYVERLGRSMTAAGDRAKTNSRSQTPTVE